jgi:hydroxyacylglutathione hydrolase
MRISSVCLGPLATNCYLIETDLERILVDPAEPSNALLSFVGDRPVDIVVLTHGHFDHIGGAWAFDAARVMMHSSDLAFVDHVHPEHPPIDRLLSEGDEVADGIGVLHVPGHSPGSIALQCDAGLIVGDLLFRGSIGRTDLPGGDPRAMQRSLRRIIELEGAPVVYPGHGPQTGLGEERRSNPYLLMLK